MNKGSYISALRELYQMASTAFSIGMRVLDDNSADHPNLVRQLQFVDIMSQRIDHLIVTHEKVMLLYIDDIFKDSFLHLQYFQFQIIAFDLRNAVAEIERYTNTHAVHPGLYPYFTTEPTLEHQIRLIEKTILEEAGNVRLIALPPLTTRQVSVCRELYTMASERIVLDWFLNNTNPRETSDLIHYYTRQIDDESNSGIQLF